MSNLKYKFFLFNDPDRSVNQSRGLNLQFNGYAMLSCPAYDTLYDTLIDVDEDFEMPSLTELLSSTKGTVVYKSLPYSVQNKFPRPKDNTAYNGCISKPGDYLFDTLKAIPASEFKYKTEDSNYISNLILELSLSDGMISSSIIGSKFRVDALILYGQAFTREFVSEVEQGSIENVVPIGLLIFIASDSDSCLYINPANTEKNSFDLILRIALSTNEITEISEDEFTELWEELAGKMHVVNDGLTTTSSFVVKSRGVEVAEAVWEDPYGELLSTDESTVNFSTKFLFTNDTDDSNYDHDVSFASPARLTVLDKDQPIESTIRRPQFVLGKVKYETDTNNNLHGNLGGIQHSYFNYDDVIDVYDVDYFAEEKPAISLFSVNATFDSPLDDSDLSSHLTGSEYPVGRTLVNLLEGNYLFSEDIQGCTNSYLISSKDVTAWADSTVIGSKDVFLNMSASPDEENQIIVSNSENVEINLNTPRIYPYPEARISVIGSKDITIENVKSINANLNYAYKDSLDLFSVINSSGLNTSGASYSTVLNSTNPAINNVLDTVVMNGTCDLTNVRGSVVIGVTNTDSYLEPTNTIENAYGCFVLGSNNTIINKTEGTTIGRESNIFMAGKGLHNDARQNYKQSPDNDGAGIGPTLILGTFNSNYYEEGEVKQMVVGGYNPKYPGDFKYNSLELSILDGDSDLGKLKGTYDGLEVYNQETLLALSDLKGRAVKYGSGSVSMYVQKGTFLQSSVENYEKTPFGRINWFKLYQLLNRLYWEPGSGYVRYLRGVSSEITSLGWSDYGISSTTSAPCTNFASLINDWNSHYSFKPQRAMKTSSSSSRK